MKHRLKARSRKAAPTGPGSRLKPGQEGAPPRLTAAWLATASVLALLWGPHAPASADTGASGLLVSQSTRTLTRIERTGMNGESFSTGPGETIELLLSDGGSITLGPDSRMFIETYAFEPATGVGTLRLRINFGAARISGGALNAASPIVIGAGDVTLQLKSGSAFVAHDGATVRGVLMLGERLTLFANGQQQAVTRPGYESRYAGGSLVSARRLAAGAALADAQRLNPGLADGAAPVIRTEARTADSGSSGPNAEEEAEEEEPAAKSAETAIADARTDDNQGALDGAVGPGSLTLAGVLGADLGVIGRSGVVSNGGVSTSNTDPDSLLAQDEIFGLYPFARDVGFHTASRSAGRTTSRLLNPDGSLNGEFRPVGNNSNTAARPVYLFSNFGNGFRIDASRQFLSAGLYLIHPEGYDDGGIIGTGPLAVPVQVADMGGEAQQWLFNRQASGLIFSVRATPGIGGFGSVTPLINTTATEGFAGVDASRNFLPLDYRVLQAGFNADTRVPDGTINLGSFATRFNLRIEDPANTDPANPTSVPVQIGRDTNNFIAIQSIDTNGRSIFFATGDISKDGRSGSTVDRYVLSRGLESADATATTVDLDLASPGGVTAAFAGRALAQGQQFRSFLPDLSSGSTRVASSPVFIATNASAGGRSAFFHADLGVSADGRSSTVSATFGQLIYDDNALRTQKLTPTLVQKRDSSGNFIFKDRVSGAETTSAVFVDPVTLTQFPNDPVLVDGLAPVYADDLGAETTVRNPGTSVAAFNTPVVTAPSDLSQVTLEGDTVGSAREGARGKPVLYTSPIYATSAGGGNKWADRSTPSAPATTRPGYAGYLVLQNVSEQDATSFIPDPAPVVDVFDPNTGTFVRVPNPDAKIPDPNDPAMRGGVVRPVGSSPPAGNFGYLRLATGFDTRPDTDAAIRNYGGFAAGLVDVRTGPADTDGASVVARQWRGTLDLVTNADANTVGATVGGLLLDPALNSRLELSGTAGFAAIRLGASAPSTANSAYVEPGVFGAQTATNDAALIHGESVKGALAAPPRTYAHTQWGFFFGDMIATADPRGHAALSTWVANAPLPSDYALKGSASYSGHMIGEVIEGTDRRLAQGSFEQRWNFDARTGAMNLNWDGKQALTAPSLALAGFGYRGSVQPAGGFTGYVEGRLGGPGAAVPQSTAGVFQLAGANGYTAIGTFGGDVD